MRYAGLFLALLAVPCHAQFQWNVVGPGLKTRVEPEYTKQALAAGLAGTVVLYVAVDDKGVPADVRPIRWVSENSRNPDALGLDEAAVAAVRQWRFSPKIVEGRPVSFEATVEVRFDPDVYLRRRSRHRQVWRAGLALPVPIILCSGLPGNPILVMRGGEITFERKGEAAIPALLEEWGSGIPRAAR